MLDFPVAPPIFIKDTPHKRKLTTLAEARAFVDEMLHRRRLYKLREVKTRLEILPYHANPRRMEFPERTGRRLDSPFDLRSPRAQYDASIKAGKSGFASWSSMMVLNFGQ